MKDRTNLISYIDASSLDGLAVRQPWPLAAHTIAGTIAEPPDVQAAECRNWRTLVTKCVRIAEFERPNDLPGWRLLSVENPNEKLVVRNGCVKSFGSARTK